MKVAFMYFRFTKVALLAPGASMVAFVHPEDMKVAFMYRGGPAAGQRRVE
jgi:hypothetical protein